MSILPFTSFSSFILNKYNYAILISNLYISLTHFHPLYSKNTLILHLLNAHLFWLIPIPYTQKLHSYYTEMLNIHLVKLISIPYTQQIQLCNTNIESIYFFNSFSPLILKMIHSYYTQMLNIHLVKLIFVLYTQKIQLCYIKYWIYTFS